MASVSGSTPRIVRHRGQTAVKPDSKGPDTWFPIGPCSKSGLPIICSHLGHFPLCIMTVGTQQRIVHGALAGLEPAASLHHPRECLAALWRMTLARCGSDALGALPL